VASRWGWHLNQAKVTLLMAALAANHCLITLPLPDGLPAAAVREGFALSVVWAFPLLLHMPESGMRTVWGWLRIAGIGLLLGGGLLWGIQGGFGIPWPAALKGIPGGIPTLSFVLALLALWCLPASEGSELRPAWTMALLAVGVAFSGWGPWWPAKVRGALWPVFLCLSSLFVLAGIYGLTWRRAYLDELTGLPGRRAFDETLRRLGRHYAIAMVDVDHFKRFNDRYGHGVGDQVLRFMGSRLKRVTFGRAYRYGGEEFALVMPGVRLGIGLPHVEALRATIEATRLTLRGKDRPAGRPRRGLRPPGRKTQVGITVSIGLAERTRFHASPNEVVRAADEALYRAKRKGRNCVEVERRRVKR